MSDFKAVVDEEEESPRVLLESIPTWQDTTTPAVAPPTGKKGLSGQPSRFPCNPALNSVIRIWKGEIWTLSVDAIVSSTNETLTETQGVNGIIVEHAGPELQGDIDKLEGCRTGEAKMTHGFALPARY